MHVHKIALTKKPMDADCACSCSPAGPNGGDFVIDGPVFPYIGSKHFGSIEPQQLLPGLREDPHAASRLKVSREAIHHRFSYTRADCRG
jgi:hypothetical protein